MKNILYKTKNKKNLKKLFKFLLFRLEILYRCFVFKHYCSIPFLIPRIAMIEIKPSKQSPIKYEWALLTWEESTSLLFASPLYHLPGFSKMYSITEGWTTIPSFIVEKIRESFSLLHIVGIFSILFGELLPMMGFLVHLNSLTFLHELCWLKTIALHFSITFWSWPELAMWLVLYVCYSSSATTLAHHYDFIART